VGYTAEEVAMLLESERYAADKPGEYRRLLEFLKYRRRLAEVKDLIGRMRAAGVPE
jgi:hypothetical protein